MSAPPYTWQAEAWARLRTARATGRVPHALLIAGPAGIGKRAFADHLGRALVCEADAANAPCDHCPACRQHGAGTHPDATWIVPPEPGKSIAVDSVRDITDRLGLTGQGTKLALIDPAEAMTTSAANSLLKTLEEPAGDAVLLLVSHRPGRLPATVRSRCQQVAFGFPDAAQARQWLSEQGLDNPATWLARAGGAPVAARELAAQGASGQEGTADALLDTLEQGRVPAGVIADGDRTALAIRVPPLIATVEDLIRLALLPAEERLHRPERRDRMAALASRLDARMLFDYLDALYRSVPGAGDSLRPDIQYQGLLADAAAIARAAAPRQGGR